MSTRCKARCISRTETEWSKDGKRVWSYRFTAVMDGSDENKAFFAATPTFNLEVGTVRDDQFVVGREYVIDFTAASN